MHGMLALHVGMHIRLLDSFDEKETLVKDAEGEVVRIEPHADDQLAVEEALQMGAGTVYLKKLPQGIWVRMVKYNGAPFTKFLKDCQKTRAIWFSSSLAFQMHLLSASTPLQSQASRFRTLAQSLQQRARAEQCVTVSSSTAVDWKQR